MVSSFMLQIGSNRSAIRDTFEFGRQRAKQIGAEKVYDFSLGNPSVAPPKQVRQAFLDALHECDPIDAHGYTSAAGCDEARVAIADDLNRRYGTRFAARNLYLTCGAAAALTSVFRALTIDQETEFIAIAPYFPEYACFSAAGGARLRVVAADTAHFQIDFDALDHAICAHTQGVIINSPNNPSGTVYSEETLRRLAALLKQKSEQFGRPVYLISDEPYRELIYTETKLPFITTLYDAAIVCYSFSKSFSLPGDRIGYVLMGDDMPDFSDVFNAVAGAARIQGYVCAPAILQRVIARALKANAQPDLSSYRANRDLLCDGLAKAGYRFAPPEGAFYLLFQAPDGDGDAFALRARSEDILVVSGRSFGCPSFVRASYCVARPTIENALPGFARLMQG